jgi:hypothetical protein
MKITTMKNSQPGKRIKKILQICLKHGFIIAACPGRHSLRFGDEGCTAGVISHDA